MAHCRTCCPALEVESRALAPKRIALQGHVHEEDSATTEPAHGQESVSFRGIGAKRGDFLVFHAELSDTCEKEHVDPFCEHGIGGAVSMVRPLRAEGGNVVTAFLEMETSRSSEGEEEEEPLEGVGRLIWHPEPNRAKVRVRFTYKKVFRARRIVSIDFAVPWADYCESYRMMALVTFPT